MEYAMMANVPTKNDKGVVIAEGDYKLVIQAGAKCGHILRILAEVRGEIGEKSKLPTAMEMQKMNLEMVEMINKAGSKEELESVLLKDFKVAVQ